MERNKRILGLFFTKGISVDLWEKKGLLDREKIIYEKLIEKKYFSKIFWFTYGINDKKYEKNLNGNIQIIPMPKIFWPKGGKLVYSFLLPFIRRKYLKQCSIYKTNQMMGSWTAIFAKWLYKKLLVLRTGYTISLSLKNPNTIKKIMARLVERFSYANADCCFVSSRFDLRYIKKKYHTKNIVCVPNFIDINKFFPLGFLPKKELIYIGRLSEEKNLVHLIRALRKTNFNLDIYGKGHLEKKLKSLAKKNNVRVLFKGSVPNSKIPKILSDYQLFILPSFYEGMPKALLEAMACGLPCIGTDVRGINEVIKHNYNGLLVKTDSKSIRRGVLKLMNDKKLRERLGKNARKTIEREYSLEKVMKKEIKIYDRLLK